MFGRNRESEHPIGVTSGRIGPEVGFEEIAVDLLQARLWIASG